MIRWSDVKLDVAPDGTHSGKLQVELLAYDRAGNVVNWAGGTQAMSIKPDIFEAVQKSGVPAHIEIDLPTDRDVFLETGVYDWATAKAGTVEVPLHPVSFQTASKSSGQPKDRLMRPQPTHFRLSFGPR
jgi:hypothetical protein